MNTMPTPYPIGTPGQPWGATELAAWRARQVRQRSHADDVLAPARHLAQAWELLQYGEVVYGDERYPLVALRSRGWRPSLPGVLVTGGVHGYETSGVLGALRFAEQHAAAWDGQANLLIVPCVSPWAFGRIHRWNFDAVDPNRHFRTGTTVQECAALLRLVAPLRGQWTAHIDLHETTDTDESEYRPALAARDGLPFVPGHIPDGFYLVDDTDNPQPDFQAAIIAGPAHRLAGGGAGGDPLCPGPAGPVRRHQRCALHHHHRGLPGQPPRHPRAVCASAGGGGAGGIGLRGRVAAWGCPNRPVTGA